MEEEDNKNKRKLVRLLIAVTVMFTVCFVPFACVSAMSVSTSGMSYKLSYFLVYCSLFFSLYAIQSSNLQDGYKVFLLLKQTQSPCSTPEYRYTMVEVRNRFSQGLKCEKTKLRVVNYEGV